MILIRSQCLVLFIGLLLLSGCANSNLSDFNHEKSYWDFDHELQYKKIKLDNFNYRIEVIPNNKVGFARLSAFLLRQSYKICGGYGFKLELIKGIKGFDYPRASPNLILPNLTAKLECPSPLKAEKDSE